MQIATMKLPPMLHTATAILLSVLCIVAPSATVANVATSGAGMSISGDKLLDASGSEVFLKGINYPYCWFTWRDDTEAHFAAMAATGVNSIRIVLCFGGHPEWPRSTADQVRQSLYSHPAPCFGRRCSTDHMRITERWPLVVHTA